MAVTSVPYLSAAYGMDRGFDWLETRVNQPAAGVVDRLRPLLESSTAMDGGGLFVLAHFFDPHEPFAPPESWHRLCNPDHEESYDPSKRGDFSDAELIDLQAGYDGEVGYADQEIGRLLALVRRMGFLDPHIVVTSDHGEELFDHRRFGHGWRLYEEQLRVPLVWYPGWGELLDDRRARGIDLAPTLLGRVGLAMPGAEGTDLVRASPPDLTVAESYFKGAELSALLEGDHKFVRTGPTVQLFDLRTDPGEFINMAAVDGPRANRMETRLLEERPETGEVGASAELAPEAIEELRALGYVD